MAGSVEGTKFFGRSQEKIEPPTALELAIKKLKTIDEQYILDRIDVPEIENKIDVAYDKADYVTHLWDTYVIADMMGYGLVGILAVFCFLIAYILRKYTVFKYIFMMVGLVIASTGGKFTKSMIDSFARSNSLVNLEIQRFDYSDNMVVNVDLVNTGKFDYEECIVDFAFYKKTDRLPINLVNRIKPLYTQKVVLKDIKRKEYKHMRLAIYTISKDLNFTMKHNQACK